jgi:hypothetical protein
MTSHGFRDALDSRFRGQSVTVHDGLAAVRRRRCPASICHLRQCAGSDRRCTRKSGSPLRWWQRPPFDITWMFAAATGPNDGSRSAFTIDSSNPRNRCCRDEGACRCADDLKGADSIPRHPIITIDNGGRGACRQPAWHRREQSPHAAVYVDRHTRSAARWRRRARCTAPQTQRCWYVTSSP